MKLVVREKYPRKANTIFGKTTKKNPLLDWSQIRSAMEFTKLFVDLMRFEGVIYNNFHLQRISSFV